MRKLKVNWSGEEERSEERWRTRERASSRREEERRDRTAMSVVERSEGR